MKVVLWLAILVLGNVAWNSGLWWVWALTIYVAIGALIATRHLASGKTGLRGPLVTLLATTLFWPVVIFVESRY